MRVTSHSRRLAGLQNLIFVVLILAAAGLLAWLSTRYNYQADWTSGGRRSLSVASSTLLDRLRGPVTVTAFARETRDLRAAIGDLVDRYQRHKADLILQFVNPDIDPQRARDQGVTTDGELVIEYQGRREHLKPVEFNEQNFTNALQRLARAGERWLVFLDGHGERRPQGEANQDLSVWAPQLESKGFKTRSLNLADSPTIPENTTVLVISNPQVDVLPGEVKIVSDYLKRGGNLLWLGDPGPLHGLEPLAEQLGVNFLPGLVVDPTSQMLGIQNAAIAVVTHYGDHPVTRGFNLLTVFPLAAGLQTHAPAGWQAQDILTTSDASWVATGKLSGGEVSFQAGKDIRGPIAIGVALSRAGARGGKEQRVIVVGDGDFLSNHFLGDVGNLDLGMNMVNWLSQDEDLLAIPAKTAPDIGLTLTRTQSAVIGFGCLFGIPLLLMGCGVVIWWRRRKR